MTALDDIIKSQANDQLSKPWDAFTRQNPGVAPLVVSYLAGGPRPTDAQLGKNYYALARVYEEDARRKLGETPPPPPPPSAYFFDDFSSGDLTTKWKDFHDAHLSASPPGMQVVPRPGGGYMVRSTVQQWPDTSEWGDAAMLWEGNFANSADAYSLPYLQRGQTTFFRLKFLLPDGSDSRYPGAVRLNSSGAEIYILEEWHTHPGITPGAYSTMFIVHRDRRMEFRVRGGPGEGALTQLWADRSAEFNHWYDLLVMLTFHESQGRAEWWLDGTTQPASSCPTLAVASNGSIPGVGHQFGIYRGASVPGTDVVYFDELADGPSRASVGL